MLHFLCLLWLNSVSPDRLHLHFVVNMTKYISNTSREIWGYQIFKDSRVHLHQDFALFFFFLLPLIALMHFNGRWKGGHRIRCVKEESGTVAVGLMSVIIMKYLERGLDRCKGRRRWHRVRMRQWFANMEDSAIVLQSPNPNRIKQPVCQSYKDDICIDCQQRNFHGWVQEGTPDVLMQ